MNDIRRALEALPDAVPPVPRILLFCAECRTGVHGATGRCACCQDCGRSEDNCRCGCPPRGVILPAKWLRAMRKDLEEREHGDRNNRPRYWTERVGALLDHIDLLTNSKLPGL